MKTRKHRRSPEAQPGATPFFSKAGVQSELNTGVDNGFFQPKLTIGKPGDRFEQEADKVADAVVKHTRSSPEETAAIRRKETVRRQAQKDEGQVQAQAEKEEEEPVQAQAEKEEEEPVQTQAAKEEEEEPLQTQAEEEEEPVQARAENEKEEPLQAQAAKEEQEPVQAQAAKEEEEEPVQTQVEKEQGERVQARAQDNGELHIQAKPEAPLGVSSAFDARLKNRLGKGKPLPAKIRAEMEAAFDTDFSAVRIHTDEEAAELNRMLGAQAFTRGTDIFFDDGKFNPESGAGKHLLAHELTHTRQQKKR
jgi:hypothetical protein